MQDGHWLRVSTATARFLQERVNPSNLVALTIQLVQSGDLQAATDILVEALNGDPTHDTIPFATTSGSRFKVVERTTETSEKAQHQDCKFECYKCQAPFQSWGATRKHFVDTGCHPKEKPIKGVMKRCDKREKTVPNELKKIRAGDHLACRVSHSADARACESGGVLLLAEHLDAILGAAPQGSDPSLVQGLLDAAIRCIGAGASGATDCRGAALDFLAQRAAGACWEFFSDSSQRVAAAKAEAASSCCHTGKGVLCWAVEGAPSAPRGKGSKNQRGEGMPAHVVVQEDSWVTEEFLRWLPAGSLFPGASVGLTALWPLAPVSRGGGGNMCSLPAQQVRGVDLESSTGGCMQTFMSAMSRIRSYTWSHQSYMYHTSRRHRVAASVLSTSAR